MKSILFVLSFLVVSSFAKANTQTEITHLLSYVAITDCQFDRNGKLYDGKAAQKHMTKKYNYFKDEIINTEDFIKFTATKSRMSGKHYFIHCPSQSKVKSKDWLFAELIRFRER